MRLTRKAKALEFKGPSKLRGTRKFNRLATSNITKATITINGKQKVLCENQVRFKINKDSPTVFIYHSYRAPGYSGRWYNVKFPKRSIREMKQTLKTKIAFEDWDTQKMGKAEIEITFTGPATKQLKAVLEDN
jgi:hypothetical protein